MTSLRGWIALAVVLAGCDRTPLFGPPTGSVCPPDSTLTYDSFGRGFMTAYCTRCHATALVGAARHGAPNFHDFDTVRGIRAVRDHIDLTAAAGPDSVNEGMPGDEPSPTTAERRQLGAWLACGAP